MTTASNQVAAPTAKEILRGLSADDIRHRIEEIDAEKRALLVLLRAAVHSELGRGQDRDGR